MKWESLENKIKAILYGHKSEVDVDALWAAIESDVDAINRKKKRRGVIWFWFGGLVLVGSAVGYFYKHATLDGVIQALPTVEVGQQSKSETKATYNENSVKNDMESTPVAKPIDDKLIEDKKRSIEPKSDYYFDGLKHKNNYQIEGKPNLAENINRTIIAQKSGKTDPMDALNPALSLVNTLEEQTTIRKEELVQLTSPLPALPLTLLDVELETPSMKELAVLQPEEILSIRKKQFSVSANAQGSISFVQRKLELKDSVGLDLLQLRKKTERELEAYQIGLGFTLQHRTGVNLSTGLNYTQINERFRLSKTEFMVDAVYGVKYLVINLEDDTVAIYGDVPLEKKTTYQKTHYNKYRMVDVPVLIGYRHIGHKFSVGVQAGVFVNLSLSTQGQILRSANETTSIDTARVFKSNVGWSYYFGLSAGYLINDNLEAYISPFMRHFPKDFTNDNYAIRQRYNLYGVNMGVRYAF